MWKSLVRLSARVVYVLGILACGDSDSPASPSAPPQLVIRNAIHDAFPNRGFVTLTLENTGGPGTYRIDFWAWPNVPNGSYRFLGSPPAVDVEAGYRESLVWGFPVWVATVVVFSKGRNSVVYEEDARHQFPPPQP